MKCWLRKKEHTPPGDCRWTKMCLVAKANYLLRFREALVSVRGSEYATGATCNTWGTLGISQL